MRSGLRHQSRTEASPLMSVVCWTHRTRASSITNKLSSQDAYHLYASVRTAANIWNESSVSSYEIHFCDPSASWCVMVWRSGWPVSSVGLSLSLCVLWCHGVNHGHNRNSAQASGRSHFTLALYITLIDTSIFIFRIVQVSKSVQVAFSRHTRPSHVASCV